MNEKDWNTGDAWCCEQHPDKPFSHCSLEGCIGPGMPDYQGRATIKYLKAVIQDKDAILALFKEETNELIPGRSLSGVENFTPIERGEFDEGWNACRQDMLERLEKWRSK